MPLNQAQLLRDLTKIEKRLEAVEELMSFMVKASSRFKIGQRVQFSAKADSTQVSARTKGGVRTGTVIEAGDSFTVKVLLDGYKRPHDYHHAFFERVRGRK